MIEIRNFEEVTDQFHLAVFGISILEDDFYLENVKLCRSKSGNIYIKFPQYKNSSGEWASICRWGEEKAKRITGAVRKLLEEEGKMRVLKEGEGYVNKFQNPPPKEPTPF